MCSKAHAHRHIILFCWTTEGQAVITPAASVKTHLSLKALGSLSQKSLQQPQAQDSELDMPGLWSGSFLGWSCPELMRLTPPTMGGAKMVVVVVVLVVACLAAQAVTSKLPGIPWRSSQAAQLSEMTGLARPFEKHLRSHGGGHPA